MDSARITKRLQNEFGKIGNSTEDLHNFLTRNKDDFGHFRRQAHKRFVELYETLKGSGIYESDIPTDKDIREMILMNIPSLRGRHGISHEILRKIAGRTMSRTGLGEIINKTPSKNGTIPQIDRKHLILTWLVSEGGGRPDFAETDDPIAAFEECIHILNYTVLEDCGMPRLDARNPFDWLIFNALCYCYVESIEDDAVDRIRTVMDALYGTGEGEG